VKWIKVGEKRNAKKSQGAKAKKRKNAARSIFLDDLSKPDNKRPMQIPCWVKIKE
jgi:hypothetical protein